MPTPPPAPTVPGFLFSVLLHLLPHHLLGRLVHQLTRAEWPPLKDWLIRRAVEAFRVDMTTAAEPDPHAYPSFNAFFTRALRPDARPICPDEDAICCPADGEVSEAGTVTDGRLVQAKGWDYSLLELLGGDQRLAAELAGGAYATIYLSPRDYHRVHMPLAGRLRATLHVPGRLYSVNRLTTASLPRLFARNERVISVFDTACGPMAVILVGATFVGSMDTVWAGTVTPAHRRATVWRAVPEAPVELARGAELGRFNMGSTVILLFGRDAAAWSDALRPGHPVRMGERIGTLLR
ncbi:MAG: archaetidylserine decarboxylase [Gammaproteobacteria bacterium]|jgi:phosphatidylserine decarboxylase|nr:archaetidylserine decarboxylase [Gammaproteobacteria bacterium]